jgi:hypothetical protein
MEQKHAFKKESNFISKRKANFINSIYNKDQLKA